MTTITNITNKRKNLVISDTLEVLKQGGLVVFPSDTVYGLLVDATNEKAVEKLIAFKNRPPGKAISVFMADKSMLKTHVNISPQQLPLLDRLLPGPFTVILPSNHHVSKKLESEKGTLGVRLPDYPLVQELVTAYGKPLTATSANLGGRSPHYSVESLLNQLPDHKKNLIDLIVDAGKLPRNKPSTILDMTQDTLKVVRKGDIVLQDSQTFISATPKQTHKLGAYIIDMVMKQNKGKPLVCILQGDLGVGKTVFVKGIAEYLGVEKVVSPTFVVYYEYDIPVESQKSKVKSYEKFIHADLYTIEEEEEFKHLGLESYAVPGTIMCIEWGEKLGKVYKSLEAKAQIVYIEMSYNSEKERSISVRM